jgi:transcriptional regulator with XRE-family HTH domain
MSSRYSEQMTLTEVAAEMGISRQRVKQIENAALEKLRNNQKVRAIYEGLIDGRDDGGDYSCHSIAVGLGDSRAR